MSKIKTAKIEEDYKIYVEDDGQNYLCTNFIVNAEKGVEKSITFETTLTTKKFEPRKLRIELSRVDFHNYVSLLVEADRLLNSKIESETKKGK